MPDFDEIQGKIRETQPSKLREMPTPKVIEYEEYFAQQSFGTSPRSQQCQQLCQSQLALIQNELQHRETFGIERKALTWGRIAGVGVIVTVAVSVVALVYSIYISKPQPATPEPIPPPTSQQTISPTNESPEPEASSNSATPPLEPTATAQPSITPSESSETPGD